MAGRWPWKSRDVGWMQWYLVWLLRSVRKPAEATGVQYIYVERDRESPCALQAVATGSAGSVLSDGWRPCLCAQLWQPLEGLGFCLVSVCLPVPPCSPGHGRSMGLGSGRNVVALSSR